MFLFWTNLKTKTSHKEKKRIPERQLAGFLSPGTPGASVFNCYRPDFPGRTVCGWQRGRTALSIMRSAQLSVGPELAEQVRYAQRAPDGLSPAAGAATAAAPAPRSSCCTRLLRQRRPGVPRALCPPCLVLPHRERGGCQAQENLA